LVTQQGYTSQYFQDLVAICIQLQKELCSLIKNDDKRKKWETTSLVDDASVYREFLKLFKKPELEILFKIDLLEQNVTKIFNIIKVIKDSIIDLSTTGAERLKKETASSIQDKAIVFSILSNKFTIVKDKTFNDLMVKICSPYVDVLTFHESKVKASKEPNAGIKSWSEQKLNYFVLPKEKNEKAYKVVEELKSLATRKANEDVHHQFISVLKSITSPIVEKVTLNKLGDLIMVTYLNIVCSRIFNYSPTLKNGLTSFDESIKSFKKGVSQLFPSYEKDSDLQMAVRVCISIFRDFRNSRENYLFNNLNKVIKCFPNAKKVLFEDSLATTIKKRLVRFKSLSGYKKYLVKDEFTFFNVQSLSADEQKVFKEIDNLIKNKDITAYVKLAEFNSKSNKILGHSTFDKYLNQRKKSYEVLKSKIQLSAVEKSKISGQIQMEHLEAKIQDSTDYEAIIDPLPFQLANKGLWFDSKNPYQTSEFLSWTTSSKTKNYKVPVYKLNENFKKIVTKYACALNNVDMSEDSESISLLENKSDKVYKTVSDIEVAIDEACSSAAKILARRLIRLGYEKISEF